MADPSPVYANAVLHVEMRGPGLVEVTLGASGFGTENVRPVLGLALPTDTARDLADALGGPARPPADPGLMDLRQRHEALRRDAARLGLVLLGARDFAARVLREQRDQPQFAKTVTRIAKDAMRNLKSMEAVGVSIEEQVSLQTDALDAFLQFIDAAVTTALEQNG